MFWMSFHDSLRLCACVRGVSNLSVVHTGRAPVDREPAKRRCLPGLGPQTVARYESSSIALRLRSCTAAAARS